MVATLAGLHVCLPLFISITWGGEISSLLKDNSIVFAFHATYKK